MAMPTPLYNSSQMPHLSPIPIFCPPFLTPLSLLRAGCLCMVVWSLTGTWAVSRSPARFPLRKLPLLPPAEALHSQAHWIGMGLREPFPYPCRSVPWLNAVRVCAGHHSCRDYRTAVVLRRPEDTVSPQPSPNSSFRDLSTPSSLLFPRS